MPLRLKRLDHFAITVTDVDRAERFYTDILGFDRVMRLPDQTLLRLGDVNVGLMRGKDLPPPDPSILDDPLGKAHHAFLVDRRDFEPSRAALAQAGVPVSEPVDWHDHVCFYFLDPDGNLLEIGTPPEGA